MTENGGGGVKSKTLNSLISLLTDYRVVLPPPPLLKMSNVIEHSLYKKDKTL